MEVSLHHCVHRCTTTGFQSCLRRYAHVLRSTGLLFWEPQRTRADGLNSLNQLTSKISTAFLQLLDALASDAEGLAQLVCHTNSNDREAAYADTRVEQRISK